jgi:hypothetical protein
MPQTGADSEGENHMGIFDKVKGMTGKAGKAKDQADSLADQHSDKIPDNVEKTYNTVSDAAEKVIPGEDAPGDATPAK